MSTITMHNPFEVLERLQFTNCKKILSCSVEGQMTFFTRKRVKTTNLRQKYGSKR